MTRYSLEYVKTDQVNKILKNRNPFVSFLAAFAHSRNYGSLD